MHFIASSRVVKLFISLYVLSISFVISESHLSSNNASVKRSKSKTKNDFNFVAAGQTAAGRQTSVLATDTIYGFLKRKIRDVGTVKIVIWNKLDYEITDARWHGRNVAVESPIARSIDPADRQPGILFGHYVKWISGSDPRTLWVSFKLSADHRLCIFWKLKISGKLQWEDPGFAYTVYLTGKNDCDVPELEPPVDVFVSRNVGNGYESYWKYVTADCAIASVGLDHVLVVYVLGLSGNLPLSNTAFQAWEKRPWDEMNNQIQVPNIQIHGSIIPNQGFSIQNQGLATQHQVPNIQNQGPTNSNPVR